MPTEGEAVTFTAAEVQAAIEAVILYERARVERELRLASSALLEVVSANRRQIHPRKHMTLDEIRRSLDV